MPMPAARPQNANYKCRQEQDRIEFGAQNSNKSEQQLQLEQLLDILVMLMRAMQFRFRL